MAEANLGALYPGRRSLPHHPQQRGLPRSFVTVEKLMWLYALIVGRVAEIDASDADVDAGRAREDLAALCRNGALPLFFRFVR